MYVITKELIPDKAQTFRPCTCLEKSKKIDNGIIKTRGCIAKFLLPKVDAGQAACVREKGLK